MSSILNRRLFLLPALSILVGCAESSRSRQESSQNSNHTRPWSSSATSTREHRAQIRGRVEAVFETALYYKPLEDAAPADVFRLSPLIVQEVGSADDIPSALRPARLIVAPAGRLDRDTGRPAVYYGESAVELFGRPLRRLVFVWWLGSKSNDAAPTSGWRGYSMTLGDDGFPLVWEILGDAPGLCVLFVSQSLENAASAMTGEPTDAQRFAIEKGHAVGSSSIVVARVLEDGPVPMGPFVYLSAENAIITTLLCRCMPSQVRDFAENNAYELRPIDDLRRLAGEMENGADALFEIVRQLESPSTCGDQLLSEVLRWPVEFREAQP